MQQLIKKYKKELTNLCKVLNIQRMNVFGSAVSNKFNENSDIDFLISFSEKLTPDSKRKFKESGPPNKSNS